MLKQNIFILLCIITSSVASAQYDVRKFGAQGDGTTNDTRAIQSAIDSAARAGGGVVNIRAGEYKIGTLILKSNIELHLMPGAVLRGSDNIKDYLPVEQQYESRTKNLYAKYFMIFAEGITDISITGSGTIDGNGLKHFQTVRPQNDRPFMIRFVKCRNVLLRDVHLTESANWTLHLLACSNVNVDGISVVTTAEGNRDGLDIDACNNVTIANSYISTTDDAIVMKATSDDVCSDIAITNCLLSSQGSAVKTGTESNGGFKNITVSNCVIKNIPLHAGIELMTVDGGIMQNILVQNVTMENVATPFFIHIGIRARPYKAHQYVERIGDVSDISLRNINVVNAKLPSSIIGLPNKKLLNISVSDYTARYIASQKAVAYNKVPLLEFDYPAANMFANLPAFGIYCRDVERLDLQNIRLFPADSAETRVAFVFDQVSHFQLYSSEGSAYIRNSKDAVVAFCRSNPGTKPLLQLESIPRNNITLIKNTLRQGQQEAIVVEKLPEFRYKDNVHPQPLKNGQINIPVAMKNGEQQLCLLIRNDEGSPPRKLMVRYGDIEQRFVVDWHEWGWAPVSLLKQFANGEKVDVIIEDEQKSSTLTFGGFMLRSTDNGYTD